MAGLVAEVWSTLRGFTQGVSGGGEYERYLAWHARHGSGEAMGRSAWWRHRTDHQESHPEGRCC